MSKNLWLRRMLIILAGQTFSLAASGLVHFALIWWLTDTTGSARILATATIMTQIPVIILGMLAGALVDRWPHKWTLVLADIIMGTFVVLLAISFHTEFVKIWHVYVILFLRSLADLVIQTAMIATTTTIVPKDQLARAAAIRTTAEGALYLLAPVAGALLLETLGVERVLPLAAVLAVVAVAPLLFVTIPRFENEHRPETGIPAALRGMADGWRYMVRRRGLWQLELTSGMWALLWTPAMSLLPLFVKDHLGGDALALGWLQSGFGVGLVAGGIVLSAWGGFRKNMLTCATGSLGIGCAAMILALVQPDMLWLAVVAAAVGGLMSPAITTGFQATLQKVVDPSMQGRYWGLHASINRAIGPLALAIATPLAEDQGVRVLWFVSAMGALLIGSLRLFVPAIYHLEDEALEENR